jgi:predicted signal transduction protein with EAL and GGDEF domain
VARLGADEFVVVQSGVGDPADAESLALRLLDSFKRPFPVGGQELMVGATIGIARAPSEAAAEGGADLLLRHAELALQRAKAGHRGTFHAFEPRMDEEVRGRRALEQDLRGALERGEFELHYQPQVDLATELVSGFEALVRWRHPVRGLVEPGAFIPVAEETGLIVRLGAWVLARACADAAAWPVPARVAVNLSPVQFITPGLPEAVAAALERSGLPPGRLELEITESVRLIDNDTNLLVLHAFRDAGIQVALDDFGTGFASLSYLRAFPFSKIKIDRSFVSDIGRDEGCLAIVRAATRLARDLGMDTIAEGIETPLQLLQLRQLGCAEGQGYLFGRPMPGADVPALLLAEPRRVVAG